MSPREQVEHGMDLSAACWDAYLKPPVYQGGDGKRPGQGRGCRPDMTPAGNLPGELGADGTMEDTKGLLVEDRTELVRSKDVVGQLGEGLLLVKLLVGELGMTVVPKEEDMGPAVEMWLVREVWREVVDKEEAVEAVLLAVVRAVDKRCPVLERGKEDNVEGSRPVVDRGSAEEGKDGVAVGRTLELKEVEDAEEEGGATGEVCSGKEVLGIGDRVAELPVFEGQLEGTLNEEVEEGRAEGEVCRWGGKERVNVGSGQGVWEGRLGLEVGGTLLPGADEEVSVVQELGQELLG